MSNPEIKEIDDNYQHGLLIDRLKHNDRIKEQLADYLLHKDEQYRQLRLEQLNNMSNDQRRKLFANKYASSSASDSSEEQEYFNLDDLMMIPDHLLLVYDIYLTDETVRLAYNFKTLIEDKHIDFNNEKVTQVRLPININDNVVYYNVDPRLDSQLDFDSLYQLYTQDEENTKTIKHKCMIETRIETIKKEFNTQINALGTPSESCYDTEIINDELINVYIESDYTNNQIVEKLIGIVFEQYQ